MNKLQEKLFPFFAYKKSQEINPEKYSGVASIEEWAALIQESPEDMEEITQAATLLTEQDWEDLEQEYNRIEETSKMQKAAKGAQLKRLRGKKTKCSCGCALKLTKSAKGGIVQTCSCGCGGK